jgi:hypothetical protein
MKTYATPPPTPPSLTVLPFDSPQFTYFRSTAAKESAAAPTKAPIVGRAGFGVARPNGGSPGNSRTRSSDTAAASLPSGGGIASGPVKLSGDVRVLKSVALPGVTGDPAAAEMRVVALSRQLEELRRLCDERVAASERERAAAADAAATVAAKSAGRIRELESAVEGLQSKLTTLTRDYLVQRHEFGARERAMTEEATVARAARAEAEAELSRVSAAADAEVRAARSATEAQASALAGLMSARADQFDDAVQAVTVRAHEGAAALAADLAKSKAALKHERERYRALETRRSLDLEGFSNDIAALKRTLRNVELTAASAAAAAADEALERPAALLQAARADAIASQEEFHRAALPSARAQREQQPRRRDAESAIAEFARNLAEANGPAQPEDDEFAEALARAAAKRRGVAGVRTTGSAGSPMHAAATSGPRRVPFSSPVAAPRYAPHSGPATEADAPTSSAKVQRAAAPPLAEDLRDARAHTIETQLADLHGRIAELDARARRFAH